MLTHFVLIYFSRALLPVLQIFWAEFLIISVLFITIVKIVDMRFTVSFTVRFNWTLRVDFLRRGWRVVGTAFLVLYGGSWNCFLSTTRGSWTWTLLLDPVTGEAFTGARSSKGTVFKHGRKEVGEFTSVLGCPRILLGEDWIEVPRLKIANMEKITLKWIKNWSQYFPI